MVHKTSSMKSSMQLSLAVLRKQGYFCEITEHYNFFSKRRKDLFGIIDIVALGNGETIGIQTTTVNGLSAHRKKIRESLTISPWLRAGNRFLLHGWRKKKGRWTLREQEFRLPEPI